MWLNITTVTTEEGKRSGKTWAMVGGSEVRKGKVNSADSKRGNWHAGRRPRVGEKKIPGIDCRGSRLQGYKMGITTGQDDHEPAAETGQQTH